jgi:stage III sporulation protein AF
MTDFLRTWLLGITAAALLIAAADSLTPAGTVKKIGKLIGGLVLVLAVIAPLSSLDAEMLSQNLTEYRAESGAYGEAIDEANGRLLKAIIEEKTAAYIEEKADALGIVCRATVKTRMGEGEYPYPYEAEITGDLTKAEKETLKAFLERDLAISAERVTFRTEDEKR